MTDTTLRDALGELLRQWERRLAIGTTSGSVSQAGMNRALRTCTSELAALIAATKEAP